MLWFFYLVIFVVGAVIGSFLNVCISRLPYEKSILWPPGSRCFQCLQPIRMLDNIPLLSYWLLGGKCRTCGAPFSMRYFWIELATALGFVLVFHLEAVENVFRFEFHDPVAVQRGVLRWDLVLPFLIHHWLLLSLLIVAAVCDWEEREIPLGVTLTGAFLGLVSSTVWAWPWPYAANQAVLPQRFGPPIIRTALSPWPVWWPAPAWFPEPGTWPMGLLTGLAGMLVGSFLLRVIRFLFNFGLGSAYLERKGGEALGLGDADLMMMAGAFIGWQPIVIAFFVSVVPGLLLGLVLLVVYRSGGLPFGPALALGVAITWLSWGWIGPFAQLVFFQGALLGVLFIGMAILMLLASLILRAWRWVRGG